MIRRSALVLLLALLGVLAPAARASYFEACRLSGTVQSVPEGRENGLYFLMLVDGAEPITCRGESSSTPKACSNYPGRSFEVGLAPADAPSLAKGKRVELAQVVVDLAAGSEPTTQTYWQPVSDCSSAPGAAEVPVVVGAAPDRDACASLGRVDGAGREAIVLRSGPGSAHAGRGRVKTGDYVHLCSTSADGRWSGVVLSGDGSLDCGVSSPLARPRPYDGPCDFGWIPTKWIQVVAG